MRIPDNVWSGTLQFLPVKTRFNSHFLPRQTTIAFQTLSKRKGVSVTSALMALFASALFHILPDCYTRVQGDCAVSLRHFLSPHVARRDMGSWVGSFSQSYSRFEDSV